MSLYTYTPQNDGTLADVADINTPFQNLATLLNGNLDSTNIATGGVSVANLASSANPETRQKRNFANYVVSGLTISTSGTLSSTIATGIAYVNGKEVTPGAFPKTFTASKDTYVDLKDDGTYAFMEVANGAITGMTMTTNSDGSVALRIAKVVTSGSAITGVNQNAKLSGVSAVTDFFQGFDQLGNPIYPRSGDRAVGRLARTAQATQTVPGATSTLWNGCNSVPFIAESNRTYVFQGFESILGGWGGSGELAFTLYLGTTSGAQTTKLGQRDFALGSTTSGLDFSMPFTTGSATGVQYVSLYVTSSGITGTITIYTDVTNNRNGVYTIRKD